MTISPGAPGPLHIAADVDTATIDLLVTNIGQLCTVHDPVLDVQGPRRREALADVGAVIGAALAIGGGHVVATGPEAEVRQALFGKSETPFGVVEYDAGGRAVVPGYVDPHTHAVFGRTRQDEYERRIKGETYLEIAAAGGGIHASVADLRRRPAEDLYELTVVRLQQMLAHGTTTVEIKSGYGLSLDDELKMLDVAGRAAAEVGLSVVRTCLAAHEVPKEYRDRRGDYVRLVTEQILPQVVRSGVADRCDVFCEPTVFNLEETVVILSRAHDLGLALTVHADELEAFGGAVVAARMKAQSADHLIKIDDEGIAALAGSRTVAVLLPGTVFSLGIRDYAPARRMVERGCAVALASDFNPGSCPIQSVPLIQSIACTQMRLTPAESLTATTLNAAWALGRQDVVGSLAPGKQADFLVLDGDDYRLVPYRAGHNPVAAVFIRGKICP